MVSGGVSHLEEGNRRMFSFRLLRECYPGKCLILGVEIQLFPALHICVTHP